MSYLETIIVHLTRRQNFEPCSPQHLKISSYLQNGSRRRNQLQEVGALSSPRKWYVSCSADEYMAWCFWHAQHMINSNWKNGAILSGLVTRRLQFKRSDIKESKFPPCINWPTWVYLLSNSRTTVGLNPSLNLAWYSMALEPKKSIK